MSRKTSLVILLALAITLASIPVAAQLIHTKSGATAPPEGVNAMPVIAPVKGKSLEQVILEEFAATNRFIVVYRKGTLRNAKLVKQINAIHANLGVKVVRRLKNLDMDVIEAPNVKGVKGFHSLRSAYRSLPFVVGVYPDLKRFIVGAPFTVIQKLQSRAPFKASQPTWQPVQKVSLEQVATPQVQPPASIKPVAINVNDPLADYLWNLEFIHAPEAWSTYTKGSRDVVVAVIDTGVSLHPDLIQNIWINAKEIPGNGIDDDLNGYVDDYYGYDFAENDPLPWDTVGHGTHVAGIIAAVANNSLGVVGVAPNVKVMALKAAPDYAWWLYDSDIIAAIDYVIAMKQRGVDIVAVSASWGALWYGVPRETVISEFEYPLYQAIARLAENDILFINAAGNAGLLIDDDLWTETPAEYGLPNIIVVGAVDELGYVAPFSNYGYKTVDLMAPGVFVLSTFSEGYNWLGYAWASGTSMATPHVSAVAALIESLYKQLGLTVANKTLAIKMALLFSALPEITNTYGYTISAEGMCKAGYLDAYNALDLVARAPSSVHAILLEPAPYYSQSQAWWPPMSLADTVPAGVNVTFKVLAGTPTGPAPLIVKLIDPYTGAELALLHDDGVYPDEYAGDGVYSGVASIPVNASALGQVQPRNITISVYDAATGALVLSKTYTLRVFNTPATYTVETTSFTWVDLSAQPSIILDPYTLTSRIPVEADITIYNTTTTQLASQLGAWFQAQPNEWYAYYTPQLVLGQNINDFWWITGFEAPLVKPMNVHGVAATITLLADPENPWTFDYLVYYLPHIRVAATTLNGQQALVYHYYLEPYYYGDQPVEAELIILANGTIIMSYKQAPGNTIAYIALNKYLATTYSLQALADPTTNTIPYKSIKFTPIPTVTAPPAPPTVTMEYATIKLNHIPKYIPFKNTYIEPVVVAGPPTFIGPDPCIARITDVNATGFTVRLQEWDYLNGLHIYENVSYLVVEAGAHQLPDGRTIQAGYTLASTDTWTWVPFPQPFTKTPVVIATVASMINNTCVTVRIKGVNTTGFWVLLQPQQSLLGLVHLKEKVAWVAVEPGTSPVLEAGLITVPAGAPPKATITFNGTYTVLPAFLASMETFIGPDPCSLRLTGLNTTAATIMVQEEASADAEIWHTIEVVGYMVLPQR